MASTGEPYGLFWNSDNGDRTYDANSFEYWLKKFFTSGVFEGDLQVQASSGMTLVVGSGYANVDGKVKFWNAEFNLTLSPANSTYPRIDTVVITRDNVNRNITCEVVTGAYSGDTPQPTAPVRTAEIYQLVLAQIYVGNGVTEITQANITDTRPDTSLCGYIAGTVTEMDFSQFTAQFESYFAQFKSQHEHDWSVWEQTQVAAYAAWFDNVKAEQIADKADWDAWYAALQEELHNLPADSAEYLQIQIDEIRENGTTGSIFHVTTTNTELEGKTLTVSCGTEIRTATFDSNLECTVIGFKSVGAVTFTSTDGIQTATKVLNIDYYSKYEVPIAFWNATVNIQGDDNLKGATVTVKDSDNTTVATIVLNVITGQGVFSAQKADTYTFNYTFSGTDYSETLVVDEETIYSLELSAGFSWQIWVDTASKLDSSDYASLAEVLADEEAIRELFTEHACVDYMAEATSSNADLETIINDDYCAKWINNRDYALDFLGANTVIKALMDEADKYGYGEWVITDDTTTPPTWGPKGNVPVMTANNAPYGTAGATTTYSSTYDAFHAFDGVVGENTISWSAGSTANAILYYKFTTPINVRKFLMRPEYTRQGQGYDGASTKTWDIVASNDGSTWETLYSGENENSYNAVTDVIENDNYYLYYGIRVKTSYRSNSYSVSVLQFYGRELKGLVPPMISDTKPYGEAFANAPSSGYEAYKAFDANDTTSSYSATASPNPYFGYDFKKNTKISHYIAYIGPSTTDSKVYTYWVQKYDENTSTWVDVGEQKTITMSGTGKVYINGECEVECQKIRLASYRNDNHATCPLIYSLQFYGPDYSEKEFEEGTTKKWLYDHGVELETLSKYKGSATSSELPHTDEDELYIPPLAGTSGLTCFAVAGATIDLTNYSLLRAKYGSRFANVSSESGELVIWKTTGIPSGGSFASGNMDASKIINAITNPNTDGVLDISSFNESKFVSIACLNTVGRSASFTELWLE